MSSMDNTSPMVMRSIYLPPLLDDRIGKAAYLLRCSKSDLMRLYVDKCLTKLETETNLAASSIGEQKELADRLFSSKPEATPSAEGSGLPMVMRSIYLPPLLDDRIRRDAHLLRCSKSDLMRLFIDACLTKLEARNLPALSNEQLAKLWELLQKEEIEWEVPKPNKVIEKAPRIPEQRVIVEPVKTGARKQAKAGARV